ncbi:hypothetical protein GSI_12593 [Ganoderma sinense ZZ0214-1]|uniref:Uncharacterized protein n=1 Tax=Ganoderma sinense ZZ0214-1 TaxID=1077348 RepID=A0A2G8RT68_9APHY|nr:hypothetical protein GSI_12593 [Ganoderma sinense ZZ0214-1]
MISMSSESYPITKFAAVIDVQYASSNESDTVPYFARGGVLLSELDPGEFALVITGHSYSATIVSVAINERWKIASDSDRQEVRFSPWGPGEQLHGQTWLYLRFKKALVYSDFNRVLWNMFWLVQSKAQILQARLKDIGYAQPSNFTKYCRQYLGDDYFDQLPESESESENEEDSFSDNPSQPDLSDDDEGLDSPAAHSASSVGESDSEATAVEGY